MHAWIFKHFQDVGNMDYEPSYREDHDPRVDMFVPLKGHPITDSYRE